MTVGMISLLVVSYICQVTWQSSVFKSFYFVLQNVCSELSQHCGTEFKWLYTHH